MKKNEKHLNILKKWEKLRDYEKNKIIAKKIFGFSEEDLKRAFEYEEIHLTPDYLDWEGYGRIAKKINAEIGSYVGVKTYPAGICVVNTGCMDVHNVEIQCENPWDAIVVAYLIMKKVEI